VPFLHALACRAPIRRGVTVVPRDLENRAEPTIFA